MNREKYTQPRSSIPAELRRALEVEAGHACAVRHCGEHTYLEAHHINGDRDDNRLENLALLCDKHHKMAHADVIDRKALADYKLRLSSDLAELARRTPDVAVSGPGSTGGARAELVVEVASITSLFVLFAAVRSSARACGFPLSGILERIPGFSVDYARGLLDGLCYAGFMYPTFAHGILTVTYLDPTLAALVEGALERRIAGVDDLVLRDKLTSRFAGLRAFLDEA